MVAAADTPAATQTPDAAPPAEVQADATPTDAPTESETTTAPADQTADTAATAATAAADATADKPADTDASDAKPDVASTASASASADAASGASASGASGAAAAAAAAGNAAPHSASLYVGDLHPDITEANLYEIFQALGPVQSIRVCRDVVTRRSLGYAYINFHNTADAERALDTMNYYASALTKNKPLRMMWMIRDPSQRRAGAGNIFVKSLEKSIDNKSLYDTFSQFGNILSCKVATDDSGNSLGHGFVHFETQEAAQAAIDQVNGKLLEGRKVYVGKFLNRREREAAGQVSKIFTNVYIKNIDDAVCNEDGLRDVFVEFGDITSIHVALSDEGKPKGFAFINYASPEMAKRAVDEMNGKEVSGKTLVVCPAQKKSVREAELRNKYEMLRKERMQKYQGVNLYIKNLSDDIDDDRLRSEFSMFGTITSCKIMRDDKGFSRGFGFVCFTQPEEATKAVTELNGRMLGQKPIYVALAQRKDVRRAQLEAQRALNMRMPPGPVPAGAAPMYAQPSPYMYQPAMPNMGQVMPPGRNQGQMNPQYMPPMGRGGPAGRGGAPGGGMPPHYMPMGRAAQMAPGAGGPPPNLASVNMHGFGMGPQRQPRQNRQRGPMGAGGPGQAGGMVPPRGANAGGGRGRGANPNAAVAAGAVGAQGGPNAMSATAAAAAAAQQYKYTTNARNAAMVGAVNGPGANGQGAGPGGAPVQDAAAAAAAAAAEPLTIEMLTNATQQQQKQMLGERLYPQITAMQPRLGGKITGMLLDMDNTEILHLLESPEALSERVDEAVVVLREHAATSEQSQQGGGQAQAV